MSKCSRYKRNVAVASGGSGSTPIPLQRHSDVLDLKNGVQQVQYYKSSLHLSFQVIKQLKNFLAGIFVVPEDV